MARSRLKTLPAGGVIVAGQPFRNRAAAAKHYGKDLNRYAFFERKYGASFEDWVTGKLDAKTRRVPISYKGQTYATKAALCRAYGVGYTTVKEAVKALRTRHFQLALRVALLHQKARRKVPLTDYEQAIISASRARRKSVREDQARFPRSPGIRATPVEFRGAEYETLKDLCIAYQLPYDTVRRLRLKQNCTFAEAIEIALTRRDEREIRAFGTVYASLTELARHKRIDIRKLKAAIENDPEKNIETTVKELRSQAGFNVRKRRKLPADPVLFGWRFRSWKAAWEYWKPVGVSAQQFNDHLASGKNIDARCQHELVEQAERGNLTSDLRKLNQLRWSPKDGGPIERVSILPDAALPRRLSEFDLISVPGRSVAKGKTRTRRSRAKA